MWGNRRVASWFRALNEERESMVDVVWPERPGASAALLDTDRRQTTSDLGQRIDLSNTSRPRWSSGYHTRHWIRGSRVQTRPRSMDFFRA